MKNIKLIGLAGRVGSGKSSIARMLVFKHGLREIMFKTHLVYCLTELFRVNGWIFDDRDIKESPIHELFGKTPRQVMIAFGTDFGRNMISEDIWVNPVEKEISLMRRIGINSGGIKGIVVSDVRYNNEAEMIKRNGGEIWLIERKDNSYANDTNHHKQEGVDIKYIDHVIHNDGPLELLGDIVSYVLND